MAEPASRPGSPHADPVPQTTPGPTRDEVAESERPGVIDWSRTARRLRAVLGTIGAAVVGTWLALSVVGDGFDLRMLAELLGIGLLVAFAVEVVVVGGAAVRGLLVAGARGDRLASDDVYLLPPQLLRRRARPGTGDRGGADRSGPAR